MIRRIRKFVEHGFVVWSGILFLSALLLSGKTPDIIGYYFPVLTPLEITSISESSNQGFIASIISGTSKKLRDCDQRSMNWFIKEGKNENSVFSIILDNQKSRDAGPIKFKGIVIGLPPEKINSARAEVAHDCLGGRVRVISRFYTGKDAE